MYRDGTIKYNNNVFFNRRQPDPGIAYGPSANPLRASVAFRSSGNGVRPGRQPTCWPFVQQAAMLAPTSKGNPRSAPTWSVGVATFGSIELEPYGTRSSTEQLLCDAPTGTRPTFDLTKQNRQRSLPPGHDGGASPLPSQRKHRCAYPVETKPISWIPMPQFLPLCNLSARTFRIFRDREENFAPIRCSHTADHGMGAFRYGPAADHATV